MLSKLFLSRFVVGEGSSLCVLPIFRVSFCSCPKHSNVAITHFDFRYARFLDSSCCWLRTHNCVAWSQCLQEPSQILLRAFCDLSSLLGLESLLCSRYGISQVRVQDKSRDGFVLISVVSPASIHWSFCHSLLDENVTAVTSHPAIIVQLVFHWDCISI